MNPNPSNTSADATPPSKWSVGTIHYTRGRLLNVFFWLLWGDFCLTLMDNFVIGQVLNLQLDAAGVSKSTIGFLNGTVMAVLSAMLVSVIGTASDRHRGRLGRRMPFLLWSTPPLAVCLLLVGFSPRLAAWLGESHPSLAQVLASLASTIPGAGGLPPATHTFLAVLTCSLVLYKLFDLFPQSVYYYLWADVIPARLMGTFACMFRIVAAVGMFVFNRFLLGWAATHPEALYIGAGGLYLLSFVAMSLLVKEGEYAPPPPRPPSRRWTASIALYCRECFTSGFYWKLFITNACFIIAVKSFISFAPIFGTKGMNLTPQRFGELISIKDLVTIVPFLILGPLADRYHPLRAGLVAYFLVLASGIASFFLIKGETSFAIWMTATFTAIAVFQAATGAIMPRLLPRERYGQFNSANSVVWQLGWATAAWLCGAFLDWSGDMRYLFVWFSAFSLVGFITMVWLYFDWKRLGGDESYMPPTPD
ncbi:MAG TPA: MFS transporter [Tepidisphaeraceae bacterium]|nr:MFS transporter [Tepidisphaeraceae bacterium]